MKAKDLIKQLVDLGDLDREVSLITPDASMADGYRLFHTRQVLDNDFGMILIPFENNGVSDITLPSSQKAKEELWEITKKQWLERWKNMSPQEQEQWSREFKF